MFLPIENLSPVLTEFLQTSILPKASGGQGFVFGVVAGMAIRSLDARIAGFIPQAKALGLLDERNRIDLEALHEEANKAIDKTGSVNLMGYVFDKADIDALYQIATRFANKE